MEEPSAPRDHSLDSATVERGRRHIARIRAQLNPLGERDQPTSRENPISASRLAERSERMSVDQINAEMAGAAEREHLESRVVQLEAEVRQLRNALATILDAAASGIAAPGLTERSPTAPDEARSAVARRTATTARAPKASST